MIHCQNCGKENEYNVNFCRFCGNRIVAPQMQQSYIEENQATRPYLWKTDEFQTNQPARQTQEIKQVLPVYQNSSYETQTLIYQQPAFITNGYRCPRCGSQNLPITKRQVSTAGWIVFATLLIFTFVFFWIGLLMKEDAKFCPVCNCKVS
jgi:DNA-directed RNA polymerase subunit RPC12/RpoP